MAIKERLIEFIDYLNISKSAFERNCKLSNGFVDKANDKIRESSLQMIGNAYPELNLFWLRTGIGEMLIPSDVLKTYNDVLNICEPSPGYAKEVSQPDERIEKLISNVINQQETIKTLSETIKSQQETIKTLSETIKNITSK